MDIKKALILFLANTLLLGGFPDFRIHSVPSDTPSDLTLMQSVSSGYLDFSQLKIPATLPSPKDFIATPTPRPTPAPTATPTPTPKPTATPKPTQVPLGKKKVQSKKPGNLTFTYPEPAELNTDPATYTLLVNKEYPMSSSYIPYMVEPKVEIYHKGINERRYLQPIAAEALETMFAAAEEDGLHLVMRCGFRSYKLQKSIYFWNLKTYGYYEVTRYHALEGTSEHQTGLAVDLCCEATDYNNNYDFLKTPEYEWMLENAHFYGWILRYPEDKTDITGYNFEPWHFRYVGVELATYLKEQDIVLEEYYGALPTTNLITVPEKYWSYLSEEDLLLMEEDREVYEKKMEELAKQPKPTPVPEPDEEDEPDSSDAPEDIEDEPDSPDEPTDAENEPNPSDEPTDTENEPGLSDKPEAPEDDLTPSVFPEEPTLPDIDEPFTEIPSPAPAPTEGSEPQTEDPMAPNRDDPGFYFN